MDPCCIVVKGFEQCKASVIKYTSIQYPPTFPCEKHAVPRATYAFQMGMIHIGPPKVLPRVLIPKNFQKRRLTKIFPISFPKKTFENWCRAELSQWKRSNLETWTSWQLHGTSRRVCGKDHQKSLQPITEIWWSVNFWCSLKPRSK